MKILKQRINRTNRVKWGNTGNYIKETFFSKKKKLEYIYIYENRANESKIKVSQSVIMWELNFPLVLFQLT